MLVVRTLTGVQISEATARRQTDQMGQAVCALQPSPSEGNRPVGDVPQQLMVSPDGALVPLVGGEWAEVKTVGVAEEREQEAHSVHLSYFSRRADAQTVPEQASGTWLRRGVDQAKQVCAVMDGAAWMAFWTGHALTPNGSSILLMPPSTSTRLDNWPALPDRTYLPIGSPGSFRHAHTRVPHRCWPRSSANVRDIRVRKISSKREPLGKSARLACRLLCLKLNIGSSALAASKVGTTLSCQLASRGQACIGSLPTSIPRWLSGPVPVTIDGRTLSVRLGPILTSSVCKSVALTNAGGMSSGSDLCWFGMGCFLIVLNPLHYRGRCQMIERDMGSIIFRSGLPS